MNNPLIGLLVIAIGSFGQSSSYVPIAKVKRWSWENFWLVQGVFAWLVFPFAGLLVALPEDISLADVIFRAGFVDSIIYGILWGVGGLTFGLSMRYLGVALGQSVSLGTCSAFGTLLPALLAGTNLFDGDGLILLVGVLITLVGISIIGYAGALRARSTGEQSGERSLGKGLAVALLAGVMSACFSLGLEAGAPVKAELMAGGVDPVIAGLPVIFLVACGGFVTNACYCIFQNVKNNTGGEIRRTGSFKMLANNLAFCALAGLLWYSQFFGLEVGKSFFGEAPVLASFSWSILMSLNVIFSNVWGIILKEWRGCSRKIIATLVAGLLVLVVSIFFPSIFN